VGLVALLGLATAGCAADSPARTTATQPHGESSSAAPSDSGSPTGSATPTAGSSPSDGGRPGGTAQHPTPLTATTHLLDWQPVPGPVDTAVTRGGRSSLAVDQAGSSARVTAPGAGTTTVTPDARQRVSDTLLDGNWAVVVLQDRQETQPSVAHVVNLADDQQSFTLDGHSDIPTVNGGTWALGDGHLLHATIDQGRYCVATVDLGTATSTLGWCAPPRTGFNAGRITPYGDSVLTFDDSRPSCRTVARVDGTRLDPFPGVPDCSAWEGLLTADGAVWAVVPHERQVEESHVYARSADGYVDLGPGVSGSLTWCDGAAWFVRDPQTDRGPAALLRWTAADGLQVAYRTHGAHGFLEAPRCGGSTMTVTARSSAGDEQVSADLG
jgi:hypothetical protein